MNFPLVQLLPAKEQELKAFRLAVEKFCETFTKHLMETQRYTGELEVVSLLSNLKEKASFTAEVEKLEGKTPALKLKISFPEEKLEYETEPIVVPSSFEGPQLLWEELLRSIRGFIDFLLENLWEFYPEKCRE
ncbi:hypothetical protein Theam_0034 [Thermovibrio ammonificans HB-1]|uniref:Uncharacterized protein n=1 Tax=Thermovibrio ammonificans (strain DSM 15698 / JCM 12110 / HB-1) TaxID=648996 RepID=E8T2T3_THEA1|nr:hypothetical protein [Thermovibrio ammonificans]ADU96008.1 hypothetical protein Theam_0034 [Thermovibrio ammonificans HB-1]